MLIFSVKNDKIVMRNIKLELRFDGENYHGWQIQPNAVTIQEKVSAAVSKITKENIKVFGCSRTDAGVHANYYVSSFKTYSSIPIERIPYAINSLLPDDIVCIGAEAADEDFHAITSAKSKTYLYKIENSHIRDPFLAGHVWHYPSALDFSKMCEASKHFIGTHDFLGFAAAGFSAKTTVRTIYDLKLSKDGNIINIEITGDGFLYNMVRIITGTLVWAGIGKIKPEDIPKIIESKKREKAGITAPPYGLYLWRVEYEKKEKTN